MAVTASQIISRVRTQLIDTDTVTQRWTDAELLKWLTDGERTIVAIAPGASSTNGTVALASGTLQNIPSNGHMLLSITRNVSGRAVRIVSREVLDAYNPNWHTATSSATVQNYIFDLQQPRQFFVYPPNNGAGSVEIIYSVMPAERTALTDTLEVIDLYQTPLVDFVLYRAHQKDSDFAAGQGLSATYLQSFAAFMQQGEGSQLTNNPNLGLTPFSPDSKGAAK
jgi:hypothetical protein